VSEPRGEVGICHSGFFLGSPTLQPGRSLGQHGNTSPELPHLLLPDRKWPKFWNVDSNLDTPSLRKTSGPYPIVRVSLPLHRPAMQPPANSFENTGKAIEAVNDARQALLEAVKNYNRALARLEKAKEPELPARKKPRFKPPFF
jgi:hypothetical protein